MSAVELIDRAGLRSVEHEKGIPDFLKILHDDACALLVETVAPGADVLNNNIDVIKTSIQSIPTETNVQFTAIPAEYELLWKIRKGLFPSIGAMRSTGTTVIVFRIEMPLQLLP